jgi:hypothetical protein
MVLEQLLEETCRDMLTTESHPSWMGKIGRNLSAARKEIIEGDSRVKRVNSGGLKALFNVMFIARGAPGIEECFDYPGPLLCEKLARKSLLQSRAPHLLRYGKMQSASTWPSAFSLAKRRKRRKAVRHESSAGQNKVIDAVVMELFHGLKEHLEIRNVSARPHMCSRKNLCVGVTSDAKSRWHGGFITSQ